MFNKLKNFFKSAYRLLFSGESVSTLHQLAPILSVCDKCGKIGSYYGVNFDGTQSLKLDAIVRHNYPDGTAALLCHDCHIKAHTTNSAPAVCEKCGKPGELYVHHLKRISPDTLFKHYASNEVKILCRSCHLDAHRIGKNKYDKDITRALYLISARKNGKTTMFTDFLQTRFIQITNPRVWHLAHYAKKSRTRKKNISRLKKIRRRIYE